MLVDDPEQGAGLRPVPEGRDPARHVRGERSESEDVGRRRRPVAECLLGRHEGRGADPQARTGERGGVGRARDAEVDHAGAVPREQYGGRLQVAMDAARRMDGLERLGYAREEQQDRAGRQRPVPPYHLVRRGAGHVRGGEPRCGVLDPGVDHLGREQAVDPAGAGHLLGEPPPELGIGGELPADGLQRDGAATGSVGQVDHAHAAGAEPGVQAVAADLVGIVRGQCRRGRLCAGVLFGHAVALSTMRDATRRMRCGCGCGAMCRGTTCRALRQGLGRIVP